MKQHLSAYLDLLRFSAAAVVFLDHYAWPQISGGLFWQFERFGHTAVIVFFVLSGFVIAYAAEAKEPRLSDYITARLARLLSVTVPALALTVLCDSIGSAIAPALYSPADGYAADHPLFRLATALTFTNQIWFASIAPLSDLPYWSLPYEFWYYVAFAGLFYLGGWPRILWCSAAAAIAGPKILLLFPLWLLGAACWRAQRRIDPRAALPLFLGSIMLFAALEIAGGQSLFLHPTGALWSERFSLYDYVAGLLVAANLLGASALQSVPVIERFAKPLSIAAGLTFSLYLYHLPLLMFWRALWPGSPSDVACRLIVGLGTLACVAVLGYVTEKRKRVVRRWIIRSGRFFSSRLHALAP
jgi:peptidoglycan/LPS O-acetylase OafA/YrhL